MTLEAKQKTLGFFSLPQEMRDQIYVEVLTGEVDPPISPDDIGPRLKVSFSVGTARSKKTRTIRYPRTLTNQGLTNCNKTIKAEIREMNAKQAFPRPLSIFKLDVVMNNVWPTWIRCPNPFNHIEHLQVTVRSFHSSHTHLVGLVEPLIRLLNQLANHGPRFLCE